MDEFAPTDGDDRKGAGLAISASLRQSMWSMTCFQGLTSPPGQYAFDPAFAPPLLSNRGHTH